MNQCLFTNRLRASAGNWPKLDRRHDAADPVFRGTMRDGLIASIGPSITLPSSAQANTQAAANPIRGVPSLRQDPSPAPVCAGTVPVRLRVAILARGPR
jgi:hypothetical protein